jgi:hypothetical protein
MSKSLQIIQRLIELQPGLFSKSQLQLIFNLVHFPNQVIREDAVKLMMVVSSEFDDQNSLLELQKLNPQKMKIEEFSVNF